MRRANSLSLRRRAISRTFDSDTVSAYLNALSRLFVIDGAWAAIEIKLGVNQEDAAAKNLLALRDAIKSEPHGRPPQALIVIVGHSASAYRRPDGVIVCPVGALKP